MEDNNQDPPLEQDVVELDRSAFEQGSDEEASIKVFHAVTGEQTGDMIFKIVKMPILDRYRDINAGQGAGRRKPDKAGARVYLFRQSFLRFEPIDAKYRIALGRHKTPTDFFVNECPMLVDRLVIEYLNNYYPDVDWGK